MEKVAASYPRDIEAKILYALAISANHDLNDKKYERPLKAARPARAALQVAAATIPASRTT